MAQTMEYYTTGGDTSEAISGTDATPDYFAAAQTFTIGTTGTNITFNVTSADLYLIRVGTITNATISIYETSPDGILKGTALSTGTITGSDISTTTLQWINVPMTSATLKDGTKYTLVLKPSEADASNHLAWREDASSPSYTGGTSWRAQTDLGTWTQATGSDFLFQVNGGDYAGTLCTLADAINKAGANASPGSKNEALVSNFVLQAESLIVNSTRFNWIDAYSELNEDVKYLLNMMTSDLAAIYIINYDMSGYTSRAEAESMINVYRESFNRGLFFLLDKKTETFMVGE